MNIADQIGFGICLVLIPYMVWIAGSAVLNAILDRLCPVPAPIQLNRVITDIHLNGVVSPSMHDGA